jgi:hypothetical protein
MSVMDKQSVPSSASARPLRYIDVVLVLLAAPILLLIGVPAVGYGIAAVTWILLRAVGIAVDRYCGAIAELSRQLTLRLGF